MIRISKKGVKVPKPLTKEGVQKRKDHISDYKATPAGYHVKTKARLKFGFDNSIYGHSDVKTVLKKLQANKCCFCEAKVSHISSGDIEHFRPKAGYRPDKAGKITYPGYYWLAYTWSNLYFSCEICNGREKRNYFPIKSEKHRAKPTVRSIAKEVPVFIDPGGSVNPEKHIHFIGQVPTHHTVRGRITIDYLGLDRVELNEHREDKLDKLLRMEEIVALTKDSTNAKSAKKKFLAALKKCVQPTSEYSGMFKSNFKSYLKQLK